MVALEIKERFRGFKSEDIVLFSKKYKSGEPNSDSNSGFWLVWLELTWLRFLINYPPERHIVTYPQI